MAKLLLGLAGHMGAGKGAIVSHLVERHGAVTIKLSQTLRDILDRLHIEQTRDNIAATSKMLRDTFGEHLLTRVLMADVAQMDANIVVLDGIRRVQELAILQEQPNFVLVAIHADLTTRAERIRSRAENPNDATKTLQDVINDHQLETEQTIDPVLVRATETIDNNGTLEATYAQVDALIKKHLP